MKVLVSVVSLAEARIAIQGKADIIDIKNPSEGSLGAQFPWLIKEIIDEIRGSGVLCSATLGDLPFLPGTASLAALGAAVCGADYIKAGLYGAGSYLEAYNMMKNIIRAVRMVNESALIVAAGYADAARFGGMDYKDLVRAAKDSGANVVMVDTAIKDGKNLLDAMDRDQIREFVDLAHHAGLLVALAGSIKRKHLSDIVTPGPDIIGIRGGVCENGDRTSGIVREKIEEFIDFVLSVSVK